MSAALRYKPVRATPGVWCDTCMLPSAWTIVGVERFLSLEYQVSWIACYQCGHSEWAQ
jgi:hypothetical protein